MIPVGNSDQRNNVDATIEAAEPLTQNDPTGRGCGTNGTATAGAVRIQASMWWEFTALGGPTTVSTTSGTFFDSVVALYDSTDMSLVGCDDDIGGGSGTPDQRVTSELTRTTIAGRKYYVQVGGCQGGCASPVRGDATLRVSSTPPNDDRAQATPVPDSGVLVATNTGGTLQNGELDKCGSLSPFAKTVWFRYTAPAAGTARFTVSGTNAAMNTVMAIYRGDATTPLACNDDAIVGQQGASSIPRTAPAEPPFPVAPGDYLIQVGGYHDTGLGVEASRNGPIGLEVVFSPDDDVDGDGYERGVDCDDTDPRVHPGATEIPNNDVDEDCDTIKALDGDGDGVQAPPAGDDCRDDRADIHPGAAEVLGNGIDEDCDGADGIQKDRDGDGVLVPPYGPDCDDGASAVRPGATEILNNDVDEDCDTINAFDLDGDGFRAPPAGGDCRDDVPAIHPGALEVLGNGIDEDCDGSDGIQRDRDADGVVDAPLGPDCDPNSASIRPGARDVPENGIDEDCDRADAAFPLLRATISATWSNFGTRTEASRLRVLGAPRGSTIELRCEGERCPLRRKAMRVKKFGDVSVLQRIGGRLRLLAGTILEVRVVQPRFTGIARTYRIVRGRGRAPTFRDSCVRRSVIQACPR